MNYIKGLNGLRAIAVSAVIFCHWGLPFSLKFTVNGKWPVDLFFVISGFLITKILLTEKFSGRTYKEILKTFFINRSLRIFPIYYMALIALYLLDYGEIRSKIGYFATYTENIDVYINHSWNCWSHAWSLSVEEQFYIIWPFTILFAPRKYIKKIVYGLIFLGILFLTVLWFKSNKNPFFFVLTPTCLSAFGIGALISCWYIDNEVKKYLLYYKWILLFSIILLIYWSDSVGGLHFKFLERFNNSIISGYFILNCITEKNKIYIAFLENKYLKKIGAISYGIYLYHYCIPYYYNKVALFYGYEYYIYNYPNFNYFLMLLMLFSFSLISFYTVEKYALSFKRHFDK